MKKIVILVLLVSIMTIHGGLLPAYAAITNDTQYTGLNDAQLHQFIRDNIYATLESEYGSDDLIIENISTTYISKEYLEEFAYNSKANVFFGYTLAELDQQFQGQRYVFTLGDNGQTIVKAYETLDESNTYKTVLKNVLIGSGILLISVTVSLITAGGTTAPVCMIAAASAKTGAQMALSGGAIGGIFNGLIVGIETGDFDQALEAAALGASEGFKLGAIGGTLIGGGKEVYNMYKASSIVTTTIPTPRESEMRALEIYGGEEQLSYLDGEKVGQFTQHASRPDLVRPLWDGSYEAIEVKNYNLINNSDHLVETLADQIYNRTINLPAGYSQRVVLDVYGRDYSTDLINEVISEIQEACSPFYPNLPVDVLPW